MPQTKEERRATQKNYRQRNAEVIREKKKLYNATHRIENAAYRRDWRALNPERDAELNRRHASNWRSANPQLHRENNRSWSMSSNGKASRRRYQRNRRLQNPEREREKIRRRQALIAGATIIAISGQSLTEKWSYWAGRCWMCGADATSWDHVKPLSKSGLHCLSNLRPACMPCNTRKSNKWPYVRGA